MQHHVMSYHIKSESPCRICPAGLLLVLTGLELLQPQAECKLLPKSEQNVSDIYLEGSPPYMAIHNIKARTATQKLEK